jgi:diguanylate cyclase (GGDEF)-like protein
MLSSEKSIAKSEQLLSALPAIVFEAKTHPISSQFILNYVNRNMIGLLGFDPRSFEPANFSRKDFETLLHPASGDPDLCVPEDDTRRFHRQFRLVVPGKGERWLDIIADPEPAGEGWILWRGVATDITETKRSDEQFRQGQERLALATSLAGIGIWEFDFDAQEYRLDDRMRQLLHVDEVEIPRGDSPGAFRISPEDWAALVHPDDLQRLIKNRARALAEGSKIIDYEFRVRWPSGEERHLSSIMQIVRKPDGTPLRFVGTCVDVTEQKCKERRLAALNARLEHMASHDALTGLPNRLTFEDRLGQACEQARAADREHVLCYMDLDRFKVVNDSAGHAAGDAFLRLVGDLIRTECEARPERGIADFAARLGGDEFALLLYDCSVVRAEHVARSLIDAIKAIRLPWEGKVYDIGASIGITSINARSPGRAELMSQADVACYAAKAAGRNQSVVYGSRSGIAQRHHQEILVASGISAAIETNRLELFAQEILSLGAFQPDVTNVELLLRMRDTNGRIIRPGSFIPAAERYDLMGSLDRWVVTNALITNGPALAALPSFSISINLSANSLNDPLFWSFFTKTLKETPMPSDRVQFEITETAMINNLDSARHFMAKIRDNGYGLILDDFGTGLSSFNYLKQFPVDGLKIDGSFIRQMKDSAVDRAIVESINEIAHKLGARTIAEFVEDTKTLEILRAIGVDQAQGYVIGRPAPLQEVLDERKEKRTGLL